MAKERKLLEQDDNLLAGILRDLSQFRAPVQKLVEAFKALNQGEFNNELFTEMKKFGTSKILERYRKQVAEDMDRLGIRTDVLRNNFVAGAEAPFPDLIHAWQNLKAFTPTIYSRGVGLSLDYISYIDGDISVTDEAKEELLDQYCRVYATTEAEHELLEVVESFIQPYLRFVEVAKKMQLPNRTHISMQSLDGFFRDIGDPTMKVSGGAIKGAAQYKARMQQYNK